MKKCIVQIFGVLFLGIMSTQPLYAYNQTDFLDELMEKSGLSEQVNQFPAYINQGMMQRKNTGVSPQELESISRILNESFHPDALRKDIKANLKVSLSPIDIQGALKWLNSPLGEKITKLEELASTPQAQIEMQEQAEGLLSQGTRVEMAQRLDVAIRASEAQVTVIENMAIAAAVAAGSSLDGEEVSLEAISEKVRAEVRPHYETYQIMTIVGFIFSYQSLTDEELVEYIEFAESKVGQRYHQSMIEALDNAVTTASTKMGTLIAKEAPLKKNE